LSQPNQFRLEHVLRLICLFLFLFILLHLLFLWPTYNSHTTNTFKKRLDGNNKAIKSEHHNIRILNTEQKWRENRKSGRVENALATTLFTHHTSHIQFGCSFLCDCENI